MIRLFSRWAPAVFLLALFPASSHAKDINWDKISPARIVLFYPGVTSWEFLTSDDHRLGMREIKNGKKECRHCHLSKEGDLDLKADEIAAGTVKMKRSHNPFEPDPAAGKKGTMRASVRAAYDSEYIYVRVEWESAGAGWKAKKADESVPDRVSLQLNKSETSFRKFGCFIACHNDLNTMPASPSKKAVAANAYYRNLDRDDVRLYAYYTRASWSERKDDKEMNKKLKEGGRIDLWSIELEEGKATPFDGWVFDDRVWRNKSAIEGTGGWANGIYSAVFKSRLKNKDPYDIHMAEGDTVSFGLAIHDNGASKRKHYVSFPFSIGLGAGGDIAAVKIAN